MCLCVALAVLPASPTGSTLNGTRQAISQPPAVRWPGRAAFKVVMSRLGRGLARVDTGGRVRVHFVVWPAPSMSGGLQRLAMTCSCQSHLFTAPTVRTSLSTRTTAAPTTTSALTLCDNAVTSPLYHWTKTAAKSLDCDSLPHMPPRLHTASAQVSHRPTSQTCDTGSG